MAVRIEDAGFEIRDMIAWVYGSGFPKSLDVSKAIDKAAGAEREVVGVAGKSKIGGGDIATTGMSGGEYYQTAPATPAARQWQGWGTALKPALEPITVARKPLDGTVAHNVTTWGTGAVNVDGCRVGTETVRTLGRNDGKHGRSNALGHNWHGHVDTSERSGRWPANFIHDGSEEVVALFPMTTSGNWNGQKTGRGSSHSGDWGKKDREFYWQGDSGSAARFFYCAKASKRDRDEGCEGMPSTVQQSVAHGERQYGTLPYSGEQREIKPRPRTNHHPTVKPTDLMRYLCRLVTPPGGIVFDPFMGSGSTGKAAVLEGFDFIGCDMTAEYVDIARARIQHAAETKPITLF